MFFTFWVVVELTSLDEMIWVILHYLYYIYPWTIRGFLAAKVR
jgi:hypothetical protein